jgi:hypothetical protein
VFNMLEFGIQRVGVVLPNIWGWLQPIYTDTTGNMPCASTALTRR